MRWREDTLERPHPERDLLIFELLYGCGLRISELAGMNLDDFDRSERWIRVRGKGRKERQVPYGGKAADGARKISAGARGEAPVERALLMNHHGSRLSDRGARGIVKLYARMISGDASLHPHSLRHAYATHLLADGADLAVDPGTAGPCAARDHAEVHAGFADGSDGGVRSRASEGSEVRI